MTDKLAQMTARHDAERARLESELAIAAAMPIAPDSCMATKTGAPWVTYRGRTMPEALALFRAFEILPAFYYSGTFGHIVPERLAPADDKRAEVKGGPFAAWVRVNQGEGFGPTATLIFYAEVNGAPYRVNVGIKGPDYIGGCSKFGATLQVERDGRGRVISRTYRANSILNGLSDRAIAWGGGGQMQTGADFTYLICADDDETMTGAEHAHACGQIQNMADALEPTPAVLYVREAFEHNFGAGTNGLTVAVPAGSRADWHAGNACFYVAPGDLPEFARHDAEYRGVPVALDNLTGKGAA
jgi:hypothetical protein